MRRVVLCMMVVAMSAPVWATSPLTSPTTTKQEHAAQKEAKEAAKQAKKEQKQDNKIQQELQEGQDVVTFYTNNRMDFVKLETMRRKVAAERGAQHPATITTDQMKQYLDAVLVSEKDLMKKSPEIVKVFNERATDFLSPILVKAFSKAKPDQMVVFSWLTKDPLFVLRNDRIVIGECWVKDNQLHIQFNKLLGKLVGDTDKRGNFNLIVDRSKGLRIHLISSAVVSPGGKSGDEAIIAMDGNFSAVTKADSVVGASSVDAKKLSAQRSLKDRLTDLDQLRKDKMITEPEYQTKRKALLDSL